MKLSYSARAFVVYFFILGSLLWFLLDNAIERINVGMRQSAESVLVDTANLLATLIEQELHATVANSGSGASLESSTQPLKQLFSTASSREIIAQIYQVTKFSIDTGAYVTDSNGVVIYDSNNRDVGADYSAWRDVRLTLEGGYGARTSYIDQAYTEPEDPKAMYVAAPLRLNNKIYGVVSVSKPIASLEAHLVTETHQLQRYAFALLFMGLITAFILSQWFTYALNKIAVYANHMAEGLSVDKPSFKDSRLDDLTQSIAYMRRELDGKEYVEDYIHSLTHELKTPITSIQGAIELLDENMPLEDRRRFLSNISTSNRRMSRLVDRMLSLAKLEALSELVDSQEFDLVVPLKRLLNERAQMLSDKQLNVLLSINRQEIDLDGTPLPKFICRGDRTLLTQSVANLLDNAISFANLNTALNVSLRSVSGEQNPGFIVDIRNSGPNIPAFAQPQIFDRFYSLPRTNNGDQSKSTGLGLSFVKEIMKLHKGQVEVLNTPNGVASIITWSL